MKHQLNRKVVAAALTAGLVFGGSGIAVAWFTEGGSGTGSAHVGTGTTTAFTITTTGPSTDLTPGGGPQSFDISIQNSSGADAHIGTIFMALDSNGSDAATSPGSVDIPGCLVDWFTLTPSVTVDQTIAAGTTVNLSDYAITEPTIAMPAFGGSPDSCQDSSPGILFTTSGF